jgi:hypothetical protein
MDMGHGTCHIKHQTPDIKAAALAWWMWWVAGAGGWVVSGGWMMGWIGDGGRECGVVEGVGVWAGVMAMATRRATGQSTTRPKKRIVD